MTTYQINNVMATIKVDTYDKVDKRIYTISASVSYEMRWQNRLTGRIYDSMSRHGFFITCCTKNVISMGIKKEKYSQCLRFNRS